MLHYPSSDIPPHQRRPSILSLSPRRQNNDSTNQNNSQSAHPMKPPTSVQQPQTLPMPSSDSRGSNYDNLPTSGVNGGGGIFEPPSNEPRSYPHPPPHQQSLPHPTSPSSRYPLPPPTSGLTTMRAPPPLPPPPSSSSMNAASSTYSPLATDSGGADMTPNSSSASLAPSGTSSSQLIQSSS